VPTRSQVDTRKGIQGHRVRVRLRDVADDDLGAATLEQYAETLAERGKIGTVDRGAECERNGLRR